MVNRNKDKSILTDIICQTGEFTGDFEVYEVNGPNIKSVNDFGLETVNTEIKPMLKARGKIISYDFPPHSFTVLKVKIF